MRIAGFFLIIWLTTSLSGQEANSLPSLQVSENSRYFQTSNGEPFFWLGDTGWLLFSKLDRDEARAYLEDRAAKGFNVIQAMVLHNVYLKNVYGDSALISGDVRTPATTPGSSFEVANAYDYWDHVDYVIQLAEQLGLYMALVPVWGSNVRAGKVNRVQAEAYAKWLANRYGQTSNVIWLNGGDVKGSDSTEVWQTIGATLDENTLNQLITFHPFGRTQSSMWFHNEPWLDFNMFQSGHRRYDQDDTELAYGQDNWKYVRDDYARTPIKPTLDGEPSYEAIPQGLHDPAEPYWNDNDVRRYAYWSVFAGASGFTYGHNAVMQMHKPDDSNPAFGVREYWDEGLKAPGSDQMRHLKHLMLSYPVFERIPDQSFIVNDSDLPYNYLIATRGVDYALIYTYTGRNFQVNTEILECRRVRVKWFNPRTGDITPIGIHRTKGIQRYTPPDTPRNGNDWVLVLERIE